MKKNIIARGAEAVIIKQSQNSLIKKRVEKGYRWPQLDKKLRKLRTRQEARLLEKASSLIPVPKIISSNEADKELIIECINGKKLSEHLDKLRGYQRICGQIGHSLALLHDNNIIHGDLTTSNLILNDKDEKVYFIDFGLGFHSSRIEDKAVDLHLIKEALEANHYKIAKKAFNSIIHGYRSSKHSKEILKRMEKVESRGRYKEQY